MMVEVRFFSEVVRSLMEYSVVASESVADAVVFVVVVAAADVAADVAAVGVAAGWFYCDYALDDDVMVGSWLEGQSMAWVRSWVWQQEHLTVVNHMWYVVVVEVALFCC
jgi:hypothetical protein